MMPLERIYKRIQDEMSARTAEHPFCAYLYDLDALKRHASETVSRLPSWCRMYYAMKANSELPVLQAIRPFVHGFEAASIGEVRKARSVDPNVPVLFGGPGKTDYELREAMAASVERFHVESLHELRRLDRLAADMDIQVNVLLRVNVKAELPQATLQMGGRATQFGMEESGLPLAADVLRSSRHVRMAGFHLHSVSNQMSAAQHLSLIDYYVRKAEEWKETFGLDRLCLNAGGGIGVNYADTDRQFDWPAFAQGLHELEQRAARQGCPAIRIDFECGRYLAAFCGFYAAEVLDVKRNHGKTFALIRGGTHHFRLPVSWRHSHPFVVVPVDRWVYPFDRPSADNGPVTVVGQLCTPKDVLAENAAIGRVRSGDVLLFVLAGAYGWSISHHDFLSHPHPEMIYIS